MKAGRVVNLSPNLPSCWRIIRVYFSFFLGLRLLLCPQDFFLQLVALGCSLA